MNYICFKIEQYYCTDCIRHIIVFLLFYIKPGADCPEQCSGGLRKPDVFGRVFVPISLLMTLVLVASTEGMLCLCLLQHPVTASPDTPEAVMPK